MWLILLIVSIYILKIIQQQIVITFKSQMLTRHPTVNFVVKDNQLEVKEKGLCIFLKDVGRIGNVFFETVFEFFYQI